MATTTNYGWETPDDTDLVKDGAAAIRTLGSSVDTTTKNLNPETTLGDLAFRSATSNVNTRLGVGSAGQVLTVAAGVPSWATPSAGDLTEVQAGVGISVASGTGPIPIITNSSTDLITTAGDLLYGTAADTVARLGIGTANQVLAVNSGATAPEWKTVGASGMTLITRQTITSSSGTNIDSVFTSTYRTYLLVIEQWDGAGFTASADCRIQLRYGSTTQASTFYREKGLVIDSSYTKLDVNRDFVLWSDNQGDSDQNNSGLLYFTRVGNASERAYIWGHNHDAYSGIPRINSIYVNEAQTYTGLRLTVSTGNFNATVALYGLAKS